MNINDIWAARLLGLKACSSSEDKRYTDNEAAGSEGVFVQLW